MWGDQQLPLFILGPPSISPKRMELGGWHLKLLWLHVKISPLGAPGRSAAPTFYFGTPSIFQKLMELESRFACRPLRVLGFYVKICPLGGVWGDQQLPIFILGSPPYLRNEWS